MNKDTNFVTKAINWQERQLVGIAPHRRLPIGDIWLKPTADAGKCGKEATAEAFGLPIVDLVSLSGDLFLKKSKKCCLEYICMLDFKLSYLYYLRYGCTCNSFKSTY